MAHKTPTYLRFDGETERYGFMAGSLIGSDDEGTFVLTIIARLLEWPVGCANLFSQHEGTTDHDWGLFWYADEPNKTTGDGRVDEGDELCLGVQYSAKSGGGTTGQVIPLTGDGVPGKLGEIWQIQLVMAYNSGDGKLYVATFVNGTSRHQASFSSNNLNTLASGTPRLGGFSTDGFEGIAEELAIMDVIQMRYEQDRSVTISGGVIVAPDGHLDPWEEMEVDGSASGGAVHLFDEGTGNPSGFNFTDVDWADAAGVDPQVGAGAIDWGFENAYGYSEGEEDAYPQPIFSPVGTRPNPTAGELRLRPKPCIWREHGALRGGADEWATTLGLTGGDTTQIFIGYESILAGEGTNRSATASVTAHGGAGGSGQGRWVVSEFYDYGGTDAQTLQRLCLGTPIEQSIGVHASQSTTKYSIRAGDSSGNIVLDGTGGTVDSPRSTGRHQAAIYTETNQIGDNVKRFYLDGTMVYEETDQSDTLGIIPMLRTRADTNDDKGSWDWMRYNQEGGDTPDEFKGLVASTATLVLPLAQPAESVTSFDDVTIVDEVAGSNSQEVGTLTYTFRHSDDGGSSWTSPATLNDANLQALTPAGGGLDVIEVTVQLDSGMDDMSTPAVRSVQIAYSYALIPVIMHHRRQMAGCC